MAEDIKATRGESVVIDGEELFDHYTLTAPPGQKVVRVDKFLVQLLPNVTRSRIKRAMGLGSITVNGKSVKISYKIKPDDVVKLLLPYPPPPKMEPEEISLDIRFEDKDMLILYKAAGVVCHPGVNNHHGTLVQGVLWYMQQKSKALPSGENDESRAGLVHRLDKNTTGIMVLAKTERALSHLAGQFFDRTSDRLYEALVWGDLDEDEGTIDLPLGRNPRDRRYYMHLKDDETAKRAVTHYKVLDRYGIATKVELKLETGRTHQIRVHLKTIGHKLIGDVEYGGDIVPQGPSTGRYKHFCKNIIKLMPHQALHAKLLTVEHPRTGERMTFEAEAAPAFLEIQAKLEKWAKAYG